MKESHVVALIVLAVMALTPLYSQAPGGPSQVQQSGVMLNAATKVANDNKAVNLVATATLTPSAGMYAYISSMDLTACQSNTGGTAQNNVSWTSTNIAGNPAWQYSLVGTANVCAHRQIAAPYPLKSAVPGTAVTIVSPAINAQVAYNVNVSWYEGP